MCTSELSVYVDLINSDGQEPQVRIAKTNAGGQCFFSESLVFVPGVSQVLSWGPGFEIGAVLVPEHQTLRIVSVLNVLDLEGPLWFENFSTSGVTFPSGDPISPGLFTFARSGYSKSWLNTRYAMCTLNQSYYLGPFEVSRWRPATTACDEFMSGFCDSNPSDPVCRCFTAKKELEETFGVPGLPVMCMDQNCQDPSKACCAFDGYRTRGMLDQGCSVTVCSAAIRERGDVLVDVNTTIYCGSDQWDVVNGVPVNQNRETVSEVIEVVSPVNWYMWLLLVIGSVGAVAFIVLIALKFKL